MSRSLWLTDYIIGKRLYIRIMFSALCKYHFHDGHEAYLCVYVVQWELHVYANPHMYSNRTFIQLNVRVNLIYCSS